MNKKYSYIVNLEVSLIGANEVFGFINISHIPYEKLEELFKGEIENERFLFEDIGGYVIDEPLYFANEQFLKDEIPFTFDFKLFHYSVSLSSLEVNEYVKNYHEELPPYFEL
jgi:hypothetical protein